LASTSETRYGRLGRAREPRSGTSASVTGTGERSASERHAETLLGEHRRMNAARKLAQLVERGAQLGVGLCQQLDGAVRLCAELRAD
jgi:hypothetical protein